MPMEAGSAAMSTTIQPIQRPREEPGTSGNIRREGTSTSPFAPRTNVNIQNSVANMAGILAKISSSQEGSMESLSPQLQKLIDNIMEQSFSLEATLAEGLGSTVESQRFSVDQLLTLSRMLGQLGTLAEQGAMNPLDDRVETLLTELKQFFRQTDGLGVEPALLHKLAFELLDAKSVEELPPELQYLFQQAAGGTGSASAAPSESLGFLKQLLQLFMPTPESGALEMERGQEKAPLSQQTSGEAAGEREGAPSQSAVRSGAPSGETTANRGANDLPGQPSTSKGQATENAREQEAPLSRGLGEGTADGKPGIGSNRPMPDNRRFDASPNAEKESRPSEQAAGKEARPMGESGKGGESKPFAARQGTTAAPMQKDVAAQPSDLREGKAGQQDNAAQKGALPSGTATGEAAPPRGEDAAALGKSAHAAAEEKSDVQQGARTAQEGMPSSPSDGAMARTFLKNTPQTVETMKQMATLLLRDATLTEKDTKLLQNFVNNQPGLLSEKDAKQLQLLLRLCQSHIPASVQQAAQQQNLPDLPKLWAFMQLCDLAYLKDKNNAAFLKKASRSVADFAAMMKGAMASENAQPAEGQRSMSFMVPLYMGDQEKTAFPAYLHVYDETEEDPAAPGEKKKETWLRVCLLTENIGAVDLTFRMYEKRNLDVRVLFSEPKMIQDFGEYISEFEESFIDTPLVLKDLKVALAGDPNG